MRAPAFWYGSPQAPLATMLAPLGRVYAWAARRRFAAAEPWRAPIPVVCVGNLVAGGVGKTPIAISIGERLAARGVNVHFVSRGYGGRLTGPLRVDPRCHDAGEVGDEPLLLARVRPTWIARERPAGIRAALDVGAEAVVMDDGFQNPSVVKDLAIVVVDGSRGFGNGRLIPAGPLRETVDAGLARADAIVVMGEDTAGVTAALSGRPILKARLAPTPLAHRLSGRRVLAFAGIGFPEKLFDSLRALGCVLVATRAFADHHVYTTAETEALLAEAQAADALVVTTAKDAVRLPPHLRAHVIELSVTVAWSDPAALDALLRRIVSHAL